MRESPANQPSASWRTAGSCFSNTGNHSFTGRSLSELVIDSTQAAAAKIVQEHEIIQLSRAEQIAFVSALLMPAEPGARLRQAVQTYRQKTEP